MFNLIGADGKEYGPIPVDTLRQWIAEGRAGATTKIRTPGSAEWVDLKSLPKFAAEFRPAMGNGDSPGRVPPIVAMLAWAMFAVAAFSALLLLVNLGTILSLPASANFHPGVAYFVHWAMAAISLPARIVAGVGLLRAREWARRLAVGLGIALTLYGAWGLVVMVQGWIIHPQMFPGVLRSPMYVISVLWSVVVFFFNIATVVILFRPDVRQTFAPENSTAGV